MKSKLFILSVMLIVSFQLVAQNNFSSLQSKGPLSLGLHLGVSQSGTDTHSWGRHGESIFSQAHLLIGLNVNYQLSSHLNIRANWFYTNISGDDSKLEGPCSDVNDNDVPGSCHMQRGWKFESPLNELGIDLEWHILKRSRKSLSSSNDNFEMVQSERGTFEKNISPYITAGVALTFTNPTINFTEDNFPPMSLQQKDKDDFSSPFLHFPIGAGVRFDLSHNLSMDVEARGVFPQTDLLDGMSAVTNFDDERNNADAYHFLSLRINYQL